MFKYLPMRHHVMTLYVTNDEISATIGQHGHMTEWKVKIQKDQLEYVINELTKALEEMENSKETPIAS